MTAKIIIRHQEVEVKHGMTVRAALQKLNIEPDSVLLTLNGELITDDQIIRENDVIKLVPVISGGLDDYSGSSFIP
jgi:thiamine biosynthesis protein ThiS